MDNTPHGWLLVVVGCFLFVLYGVTMRGAFVSLVSLGSCLKAGLMNICGKFLV